MRPRNRVAPTRAAVDGTLVLHPGHPPNAQHLLATVRAHWGIENNLHWILDVAFREDESRVRTGHASRNLCLLRRMALNLLRQDTTIQAGVAIRRRKAGRNLAYREQVLGLA
ncbi:MAG: ISAs1 family transposase [Caldilineaceae bacterium]|nr:ISAs1 family transposase [Caldilineaceae bacterium]